MQRTTIYDIAKLADVSASTVSRVINNKSSVKKATRDKVMRILTEHDYIPNETARNLVLQSSRMIGILITDIRTTHHTDGIYHIERELSSRGYTCLIYNTGRDENDWIKYIRLLRQRKVEAAVLMGSIFQSETVLNAIQMYLSSIPVILCNGIIDAPNVYNLLVNEREGVADCVKLLADKGRRCPCFLYDHLTPSNELKMQGFEFGMMQHYSNQECIIRKTGNSIQEVYEATRCLILDHPEVDSIVFSEDVLALTALRVLSDFGKKVPEDIALIGINNSKYAEMCIPTLTSLDNAVYDLSMNAVRNVVSLLDGQRVSKKMILCTEIVERNST